MLHVLSIPHLVCTALHAFAPMKLCFLLVCLLLEATQATFAWARALTMSRLPSPVSTREEAFQWKCSQTREEERM